MLKSLLTGAALGLSALTLALPAHAAYPERSIQAVVPWGAGGATDNVMRSLSAHVEKELDTKLVITNRPGGTALIGGSYVKQQKPNGYTLLLGAENPQLYQVMGLADFDYSAFYPVNIIAQNSVLIAVLADSPWQTMDDLLNAIRKGDGNIRMGSTGVGALQNTVFSMFRAVEDLKVREVNFQGEGPIVSALLGGHIDFTPLSFAASKEMVASGKFRALAVFASEETPELPGVEPITKTLPDLAQYLPWGPFYGVFVHKDTPDDIKQTLVKAYANAVASEDYQAFLKNFGAKTLNIHGTEADAFLKRWQSVTTWSMYKAKAVAISPESVGIAQP